MNGGVSKAWTRRSRVKLSKALQQTLLDAVASHIAEPPRSHREPPLEREDPAGDATPQARKRCLDASDPIPAKRARLTRTDTPQPGVEDETTEQVDKTALQQPTPSPSKRPYATFLKDFVDPIHPEPPASIRTFVSEWLQSVGSDRETHCRSDSCLHHLEEDDVIPRQLAKSAPEMGYSRDADGFTVPPTPASTGSRSRRRSSMDNDSQFSVTGASGASTPSSGVRHRMYRQNNLRFNHIYVQRPDAPFPNALSGHIDNTLRAERDSPELSADEMKRAMYRLSTLADGCDEEDVAAFLNDTIFPNPETDPAYGLSTGLASSSGAPMSQHLVPADPASPYKVTQPKPDKLYGYSGKTIGAFTQPQLLAQTMLHPNPDYPTATSQGLRFPFFAIEFKAAGGTRGDLWVATNQCAGASSACLKAVHQLNSSLPNHPSVQRVDNLSYCIAVDNNTAQLYISWKEDDLNYYLQRVDAFLLSSPDHFKNFRKQVRNILDWGKGARLNQIQDALDVILEENRRRASEAVKSRQPPSDGSRTSRRKNRKSSLSQLSRGTNESYWESQETASQDEREELSSFHPQVGQHDQIQALTSFESAAGQTSFTTTSSFGQEDSYVSLPNSYCPAHPQQSFEPDYSQTVDDEPAPLEYDYPEDDQQDCEVIDGTSYESKHPRSSKYEGQRKAKQRRHDYASNSYLPPDAASSAAEHRRGRAEDGQDDGHGYFHTGNGTWYEYE